MDTPPASQPQPIAPPPPAANVPVLQKLSNPPFHRGKFPFLGILASMYEHVTTLAAQNRSPDEHNIP